MHLTKAEEKVYELMNEPESAFKVSEKWHFCFLEAPWVRKRVQKQLDVPKFRKKIDSAEEKLTKIEEAAKWELFVRTLGIAKQAIVAKKQPSSEVMGDSVDVPNKLVQVEEGDSFGETKQVAVATKLIIAESAVDDLSTLSAAEKFNKVVEAVKRDRFVKKLSEATQVLHEMQILTARAFEGKSVDGSDMWDAIYWAKIDFNLATVSLNIKLATASELKSMLAPELSPAGEVKQKVEEVKQKVKQRVEEAQKRVHAARGTAEKGLYRGGAEVKAVVEKVEKEMEMLMAKLMQKFAEVEEAADWEVDMPANCSNSMQTAKWPGH